jgi:hypothetical protein
MARGRKKAFRKNLFGAISMVTGVVLLMWGNKQAHSTNGQLQYLLFGSPGHQPALLMAGGGALIALGIYLVFWKQ